MSAAKTIRRTPSEAKQQAETYRYWQSQSVGDRLTAVWELSAAAYAFRDAFGRESQGDGQASDRTLVRVRRASR